MAERILYSDPATSSELAALPYEELGSVDNGVWVACPDQTVQALAERRPPVFLYFDRHDYDTALANLTPARVQEVIRHRRDRWAPQAKSYIQWGLFEDERASLEGALGLAGGQPGTGPVERSLLLLQRMAGLERYLSVPAKAMAITVLQGESLLLATLKAASDGKTPVGTQDDRHLLSIHRDRRQLWTGLVARVAVALGAKEFENALPFAEPARGVFVHPADEGLKQSLIKGGEAPARWRDGLVFVSAERRQEEFRQQKLSVDLLYADPGEFYDSIESLTEAQLHRDFAARLERPPAAARQDILGHIDRLHLHQILMKRELRARADAARACEFAGFDTMLSEEATLLGYSLGRTQTFSRSRGMDSLAPAALYHAAETDVAAGLWLFGKTAARYWPGIERSLKELETLRTA